MPADVDETSFPDLSLHSSISGQTSPNESMESIYDKKEMTQEGSSYTHLNMNSKRLEGPQSSKRKFEESGYSSEVPEDRLPSPITSPDTPVSSPSPETFQSNTGEAEFWHRTTFPLLHTLLSVANYPIPLRDQYISFFESYVIPTFGSGPSSSQTWTPHLTFKHSPFEPSWNIQRKKQQVRYTFEPVGLAAGTDTDLFNQQIAASFVDSLPSIGACPTIDLEWWQYFTSQLFVAPSENEKARSLFPPGKAPPTCFLAFDLDSTKSQAVLKPYLFPHRRALLSGKSTTETVLDIVRRLDSPILPLLPALSNIEKFLAKQSKASEEINNKVISNLGGEEKEMSIEMVSIDCIDSSKARIKLYVKSNDVSFSNIEDLYTLHGQRKGDEIQEGLDILKTFWECLFGGTELEQVKPAFMFIGLEILPGIALPDVKLYIPSWTCGLSPKQIDDRIQTFFKSQDWEYAAAAHANLRDVLKSEDGCGSEPSHTYISFTYSREKGPYITLYYSPAMNALELH